MFEKDENDVDDQIAIALEDVVIIDQAGNSTNSTILCFILTRLSDLCHSKMNNDKLKPLVLLCRVVLDYLFNFSLLINSEIKLDSKRLPENL